MVLDYWLHICDAGACLTMVLKTSVTLAIKFHNAISFSSTKYFLVYALVASVNN